jgi:hypothetical protein
LADSDSGPELESESESESDIRTGIKSLNLQPRSRHASPHSGQPIKRRNKGGAKDVWSFFEKEKHKNVCLLCKYVYNLYVLCVILFIVCFIYREVQSSNPDQIVTHFGMNTGTSVLRKHLYTDHINQWVTTCDNLKIPITAQTAKEAVRKFRKEPTATPLESERPKYSREAFIDAIVDWVVGDDQVRNKFYFFRYIFNQNIVYQCC